MDPQAILGEIMKRHGASCSVEEFHAAVNVTFHDFESEVYDVEHACMWESLPRQFDLLAADWLRCNSVPQSIRMLDIGCGTGLATDSILNTDLRGRIQSICLLDTSPSMLRRVAERAKCWPIAPEIRHGLINSIEGDGRFELIVTCSVLHHVPDLPSFLRDVRRLQAPGGVFLHIQDPNGDYLNDDELKKRIATHSRNAIPEWAARLAPRRILGRISRELTGKQGQDYISKTNSALVGKGIVESPLSAQELFQITDIHVQDGEGISVRRMKEWMPDYDLISARSYAFWGALWSELPPPLRQAEEEMIGRRAMDGQHISALWQLAR